ncbi:MAG: hypothetical protein GEU28_08955 [Dehalococcoidia bacterium]|nr:hypothetical protein [Dehalococcoidia bacterium]
MSVRRSILLSAIFFTPLAALALAGELYLLSELFSRGASVGRVFSVVVVGLFALLFLYQSATSILDLPSQPVTTEGRIEQKWSRNDMVVFGESSYIRVRCAGDNESRVAIFKIDRFWWEQFQAGDDVSVVHFPHTGSVEAVARVEAEQA